jgi:hypothetical protein
MHRKPSQAWLATSGAFALPRTPAAAAGAAAEDAAAPMEEVGAGPRHVVADATFGFAFLPYLTRLRSASCSVAQPAPLRARRVATNAAGGSRTLMKAAAADLCTQFVGEPLLLRRFLELLLRIADGAACEAEARLERELPELAALEVCFDTQKGVPAAAGFLRAMMATEWPHVGEHKIVDLARRNAAESASLAAAKALTDATEIINKMLLLLDCSGSGRHGKRRRTEAGGGARG